jgi:glycosyltransferase involved in cell wall biosynthesis
VLSTVPYIHDHTIGYCLKRRFGLPWIADYRDPIVGNPFRTTAGIPGLVDRFLDSSFFARADLLVAVTDYVQHDWVQRCPEVAAKSAVVWNGYDPEEHIAPRPIRARPYRSIAHFGNLYGGRSPDAPLASARRLIRRGVLDPASLRFQLVGNVDPAIHERHRELFEELTAMGCLEFVPPMPRLQALEAMMESDSLMLADNNQAAIGHTVPAKLFEYIRVRRPILALTEDGSPVERILAMSGVPFVRLFSAMTESLIDMRLLEFLNLSTQPSPLSERFLVEFNGRNQVRTLAGMLDRMLDTKSNGSYIRGEERNREMVEV